MLENNKLSQTPLLCNVSHGIPASRLLNKTDFSLFVQGMSRKGLSLYFVPYSQDPAFLHFMIPTAEGNSDLCFFDEFFHICKYEVQQCKSLHLLLSHQYQEVFIKFLPHESNEEEVA